MSNWLWVGLLNNNQLKLKQKKNCQLTNAIQLKNLKKKKKKKKKKKIQM